MIVLYCFSSIFGFWVFTPVSEKKNTLQDMRQSIILGVLVVGVAFAQTSGHNHSSNTTENTDLATLSGQQFDRAFLSMMIPHHQEAINMAKVVQPKIKDSKIKQWAKDIITAQQSEINTMRQWLETVGGMDLKMQSQMKKSMAGMTSSVSKAPDPEREFVVQMLPHHASAVDMANLALQKSDNEQVLKLSRDIIVAQANEMYAFKQWLKKP